MREYKVFTPEEIEKAKTDVELRNEIVLNYYGLAKNLTSKFFQKIPRPVEDFDDYLNEALIGINNAIYKYDGRGEFLTFAYAYMKGHIQGLSRRKVYGDKQQHTLKDNEIFNFDRMQLASMILDAPTELCENKTLKDSVADETVKDITSRLEAEELWNIVKKHVKPRAYDCLYLRFVYGYTYDEIAEILGCTKQNVNHSVRSSLARLREVHELKKYIELL